MHRAVVLATLVVLAGCSLPVDPVATPEQTVEPWSETTFVVGLDGEGGDQKFRRALRNATDYWEDNAETYLGHPVTFRVEPAAENPDIRVTVVEQVDACGRDEHTAGCAPRLDDLRTYSDTVSVQVQRGFDRNSTERVMKHEFGHVLGLDHDDDPQAVMQSKAVLASTARPNATERAVPWDDPTLTVYVDEGSLSETDRAEIDAQIGHAIDYYNDGGEGTVPANVTFTRIANRSRADIVVAFPDALPCGESPGSCLEIAGVDPDQDGARERYTRGEIYLSEIPNDAVGWHVGRWFGAALGADDPGDLPPAFRSTSPREQRSEWWT